MGKALHNTPEAVVWMFAMAVAYWLAGIMFGLLVAPGNSRQSLVAAAGVGVAAIVAAQVAKASEWAASTRAGQWLWRVVVSWCAEDAIEREQLLAETEHGFVTEGEDD